MEIREIPTRDAEQEWIAKYRRALDATAPIQPSRVERLRRAASGACGEIVAVIRGIWSRWIEAKSFKTDLKVTMARVQELPAPTRKASAGLAGEDASEKAC